MVCVFRLVEAWPSVVMGLVRGWEIRVFNMGIFDIFGARFFFSLFFGIFNRGIRFFKIIKNYFSKNMIFNATFIIKIVKE